MAHGSDLDTWLDLETILIQPFLLFAARETVHPGFPFQLHHGERAAMERCVNESEALFHDQSEALLRVRLS